MEEGALTREDGFRRALECDPFDEVALMAVGQACEERGCDAEARELYWRAITAQPFDYNGYMFLCRVLERTGDDPELRDSLIYLALRRLAKGSDDGDTVRRRWLEGIQSAAGDQLVDPELLLEAAMSLALDRPGEPASVLKRLRPYRLIQEVMDPPLDGLSESTVDQIVENGAACTPLLIGILRGWARRQFPEDSYFPAEAALALLGEIGDPSALPGVLEFSKVEDEQLAEIATWAARRIAKRHPGLEAEVRGLPSADEDLTVYNFCCVPPGEAEADEDDSTDEDDVAPPVRPERNQPCWCGSGKKYKKCHLASDEEYDRQIARAEEEEEDDDGDLDVKMGSDRETSERLLSLLKDNVNPKEMKRAVAAFFGPTPESGPEASESDQIAFFDWLLNDYSPRRFGRPVTEEYLARYGANLSELERKNLENWVNSRYCLFEVQLVKPGLGAELKDLLLGETFFVHDVSSSKSMARWDCVLTRVRDEDGRKIFTATGLVVPRVFCPELREWIISERKDSGLDWHPFLRANSHRIRLKCLELYQRQRSNLRVVNTAGDALLLSKAIYKILDKPAMLASFENSPALVHEQDKHGSKRFTWMETPVSEGKSRLVLGSLRIEGDRLILECNSRQRLEQGASLIAGLAGGAVEEKGREYQGLRSAMDEYASSPPAPPEKTIPPEVERRLLEECMAQHYSSWPDTSLPALGGMTPRQAAERPEERERLVDLLKTMENGEDRKRREGRAWFDFSAIKTELRVDY